jgi:hypothetical protein
LPDAGPLELDGIGEPMLPGAAFVDPGIPGLPLADGRGEPIDPGVIPPGELIGRGTIVRGALIVEPPIELPPIELPPVAVPFVPLLIEPVESLAALPPPLIAVDRQTYFPEPLPYCEEPFA